MNFTVLDIACIIALVLLVVCFLGMIFISDKFKILKRVMMITYVCSILFVYIVPKIFSPPITSLELSERIGTVSTELKDISTELDSIQKELETRIELVSKLKQEAENAEAIKNLSKEQVDAIQMALNAELGKSNTMDFWISFGQNAFFFAIGIVSPMLWKKIRPKKTNNESSS